VADVDFDRRLLTVRRSITSSGLTTPKSGRASRVVMAESLTVGLFDLLAARRQEAMTKGWPELPEWVLCSETGSAPDPANIDRVWRRIRRRAQKQGIRPLKLHCARHTWATMALQAGKNVRWVADQLGHADPALTLRVYAHAIRSEEEDVDFADFGCAGRRYTAVDDLGALTLRNQWYAGRDSNPHSLRFAHTICSLIGHRSPSGSKLDALGPVLDAIPPASQRLASGPDREAVTWAVPPANDPASTCWIRSGLDRRMRVFEGPQFDT
jgi:hypothetical protein